MVRLTYQTSEAERWLFYKGVYADVSPAAMQVKRRNMKKDTLAAEHPRITAATMTVNSFIKVNTIEPHMPASSTTFLRVTAMRISVAKQNTRR